MDLLGNLLLTLRITDSAICHFELVPPWGFEMPRWPGDRAILFSPVDEPCWLSVEGGTPVCVEPGDSALVLGGLPHVCQSDVGAPVQVISGVWQSRGLPELGEAPAERGPIRFPWQPLAATGAAAQRILALAVVIEDAEHNPVLSALPRPVLVRQSAGRMFPWLPSALQFLLQEEHAATAGYAVTERHLATLIFTSLVRAHVVEEGHLSGSWLRGLADPKIGKALSLIHAAPGRPWTLQALAEDCGMSRTHFARRFAALVGRTPMAHLAMVRMNEAGRQLVAGTPVGQVAENVGFQSDWSFRRAFMQHYGTTPRRFARA